ncbi:hypothetical protein O0I10_004196 [Lichtheimia ornata]|uniref:Uncharacterized protein n=1 Tax=Lichtheimia ornata TaxID=688661 RepID=A0AAD7V7Y9_9FUNG|nr:uncharacterized protein O0I10_004196 [Lichtheimia ornata]KAJ8659970.1 hypothetical protein O0I10_004196 [Lichtheimia ornata]
MHSSLLVRRTISARSAIKASRSYSAAASTPTTAAPAVPLQHQEFSSKDQEMTHNTIHALYNTENQSMLDHPVFSSSSQQVHSVASEFTHSSGADCFSPTFNTVFDE